MAAEAISKIKTAEDAGAELVKSAQEAAKEIIKKAEREGAEKKNEIIKQALKIKNEMLEKANADAQIECVPLIEKSEKEILKINNPDGNTFKKTINLIVERIVNINGNS